MWNKRFVVYSTLQFIGILSTKALHSNLVPCEPNGIGLSDWSPCKNGGVCLTVAIQNEKRYPLCLCTGSYSGLFCQYSRAASSIHLLNKRAKRELIFVPSLNETVDISQCTGTALTCANGGRCFQVATGSLFGRFCLCPSGFSGVSCATRGNIVGEIHLRNPPRWLVTWDDKLYISLSYDPRILVFDKSSIFNQSNATELMDLPVPSMNNYGLAIDSNGTLYVSSYSLGHLYKVDRSNVSGKTCFSMLKPNITRPTAVALDGKGHIFIWSNMYGGKLSRHDIIDGSHNQTYDFPCCPNAYGYAILIKNDVLYLGNSNQNQVLVFDILSDGSLVLQRLIPTESEPRGIAVDNGGNIFVASCWNDDLSMYDVNGNLVMRLLQGRLKCPWGLWRDDKTGYIFVADSGNNAVKVVDYSF